MALVAISKCRAAPLTALWAGTEAGRLMAFVHGEASPKLRQQHGARSRQLRGMSALVYAMVEHDADRASGENFGDINCCHTAAR